MSNNYKYDPQTGRLLTNQTYLDQGFKFDPTTGLELDTGDGGLFADLSGNDMVDGVMGIGQLGLGFMNMLDNRKVKKAQIAGLNEQIASSKYARGAHKNFVSGTAAAFA